MSFKEATQFNDLNDFHQFSLLRRGKSSSSLQCKLFSFLSFFNSPSFILLCLYGDVHWITNCKYTQVVCILQWYVFEAYSVPTATYSSVVQNSLNATVEFIQNLSLTPEIRWVTSADHRIIYHGSSRCRWLVIYRMSYLVFDLAGRKWKSSNFRIMHTMQKWKLGIAYHFWW